MAAPFPPRRVSGPDGLTIRSAYAEFDVVGLSATVVLVVASVGGAFLYEGIAPVGIAICVLAAVLLVAAVARGSGLRLSASGDRIVVHNLTRSEAIAWEEIERIEVGVPLARLFPGYPGSLEPGIESVFRLPAVVIHRRDAEPIAARATQVGHRDHLLEVHAALASVAPRGWTSEERGSGMLLLARPGQRAEG